LLGTTTTGVVTATTISGDITIDGAGVASIAANSVTLGTDTTGNYLVDLAQGTGISISHTPGEGSTASVSLNATLDDLSNTTVSSPSSGDFLKWNGSAWVNDAIDLGTDTTGNYVSSLVAGTGITLTNNSGESATPTIAIGQSVATNASVEFYHIAMTGPVDASNTVATKQYVDQVAAGIDWHESVALGSAAALPNTPTYDNGSSGDGATLTAGANARLNLDGANAVTGTRVLVKNQVNATHNGVYDVTEQGSVSVPWVLTRAEDFDGDTGHEIFGGEAVFVTGGTVNIRQGFTVTSTGSGTEGAHEFGTDNVAFTQFTGTAAFVVGDGLAQNGNEISVGTASTDRIVLSAHAIDLATVTQTNTTGSDGTSFVQSHSVDSYGRITGTVTATVQDGGTSQKGIARFNSDHFSVSSGSVSIGQAVGTSSSVTFAAVNAPLTGNVTGNLTGSVSGNVTGNLTGSVTGNADTATQLQTARTISLTGDVTGSVSFSGSADVSITATIPANSVALGTDTTGNYMSDLTQGTGITITHTPGEGSNATIAIGQDVSSSAVPTFGGVNLNGIIVFEGTTADDFETFLTVTDPTADRTITLPDATGTVALTANKLSDFAATSSSELAGIISDETGSGALVFANTPTLVTPNIGAATGTSLVLSGDLTVNGTTVTVNSTTVTIDDPIFTLGGDTAPGSDDNKDRGIEFRYHSGTAASVGFMGYDDSTQMFTFLTGATNSSEVFSGTNASVQVGSLICSSSTGTFGSIYRDAGASATYSIIGSPGAVWGTSGNILRTYVADVGGTAYIENRSGSTGYQFIALYGQSVAGMQFGSNDGFTFQTSKAASVQTTFSILTSSVAILSSASVTLPSKTFFPEEYLTVSSSVTLNSTTHRYATLEMTASAGTSVISVPTDASDNFPIGTVIQIIRVGAGEVQVTAVTPGTTTVNNALGTRLRAQWSTATLRKRAANTWLLSGDLKV
jgi:hypothetical protein